MVKSLQIKYFLLPLQYRNTIKTMAQKIKANQIDWEDYRESVENSIRNERLWATEFSRGNIADLEHELDLIDNEDYEELLDMYDDDIWERYLK